MMNKYILDDNGVPAVENDTLKWGLWFETHRKQRIVKQEMVGKVKVSTVFLCLDHGWTVHDNPQPILWETMVFRGNLGQEMDRCSGTRKDALAMHKRMVRRVKKGK